MLPRTWIDWEERVRAAQALATPCRLCPRGCAVDRATGRGFCRAGTGLTISSIFAHHGEEPPLVGTGGSGTIFFTYCTLQCVFCQNYQLSHQAEGQPCTPAELAQRMLWLQEQGCHNINLVTPDHFLPWILMALREATDLGLALPVVYNCSGYESVEALKILDGIVDIYLPDMKYGSDEAAAGFSQARDYVALNQAAIREMFRQAGPLRLDKEGLAVRGLIIRHLVLPDDLAGSAQILDFLQNHFAAEDICISLMAQYQPTFRAADDPRLNRRITVQEYESVKMAFLDAGFEGFFQEQPRLDESFLIDFTTRKSERLGGH